MSPTCIASGNLSARGVATRISTRLVQRRRCLSWRTHLIGIHVLLTRHGSSSTRSIRLVRISRLSTIISSTSSRRFRDSGLNLNRCTCRLRVRRWQVHLTTQLCLHNIIRSNGIDANKVTNCKRQRTNVFPFANASCTKTWVAPSGTLCQSEVQVDKLLDDELIEDVTNILGKVTCRLQEDIDVAILGTSSCIHERAQDIRLDAHVVVLNGLHTVNRLAFQLGKNEVP